MQKQCLLSAFSRYCCSKLGQYYKRKSNSEQSKRLKHQRQIKKTFGPYWNCIKSDCLTRLGDFEWF